MDKLFTLFIYLFIQLLKCHNKLFLQNLRVKYYKEGDWISEKKLAEGLDLVDTV